MRPLLRFFIQIPFYPGLPSCLPSLLDQIKTARRKKILVSRSSGWPGFFPFLFSFFLKFPLNIGNGVSYKKRGFAETQTTWEVVWTTWEVVFGDLGGRLTGNLLGWKRRLVSLVLEVDSWGKYVDQTT